MSLAIRVAARLLPAGIRDRYREQWLADARDAPEAGIRPSSIALAALAFAVTFDRPMPWSRSGELTPDDVVSRSRLATGLALSAALLSLAHFTSLYGGSNLTGITAYDTAIQLLDTILAIFVVVAPIVAVVIVLRTQGTASRVRAGVVLLALAVLSPLARILIDSFPVVQGEMYYGLGGLAYIAGAIVVVVALRLLWIGFGAPAPRHRPTIRATVLAALAVLAVGTLGFAQALALWVNRSPLVWSWEPARGGTMEDGKMVFWDIPVTQADYEQWLSLSAQFEVLVTVALIAFAVWVVVSTVSLAALALRVGLPPLPLAIAAIATELIGAAALLMFMGWTAAPSGVSTDVPVAVGRVLLVAVTLVAVGGVRLARVRHRHDVEGGVELL